MKLLSGGLSHLRTVACASLLWYSGVGTVLASPPSMPPYAEDCEVVADDGAWCWFSDPRAVYVDSVIIGGAVDREGSIRAFSMNPTSGEKKSFKLHDKLDYDDHANPSFLVLPDKRVAAFYSAHGGTKNSPIYYRVTKKPGDISEWDEELSIRPDVKGPMGVCYTNPALLTGENGRIYFLFRGPNFKPNMVYTDDLKTWSPAQTLIQDEKTNNSVRPYLKATNNGKDKIFLAFTDGHPRNEPTNSIYFAMYRDGSLWGADGRLIGKLADGGAVPPSRCDKVYDAGKTLEKAWIWDVAFDENEYPVLVYARFSNVLTEHSYWYARWDGSKWNNHKITKAGRWFQRNVYPKEQSEYECNYSGGVYLDHDNPDVVYASRPVKDIFEIERWETSDKGKTWKSEPVTASSRRDNVRPFVVSGTQGKSNLLWMYNYKYPGFRAFETAIRMNAPARSYASDFRKQDVLNIARKVADWQISYFPDQPSSRSPQSWLNGALYVGMFDWAELSGDKKYDQWLQKLFNRMIWQVGPYMYHADDICVGQAYLDMYAKHGKKLMKMPTQARADWVIANRCMDPAKMIHGTSGQYERWSWCDALFMAPPVYARLYTLTGDEKYMEFASSEYKATYDKLYDVEERLFFRDASYINKKEANGQKVFWGRGNGWVMGGLAEILKALPADDKRYRPFYEKLFVEMCDRLAGLQQEDGCWHASLSDPASYPAPETSATGFMTYAMAYGINAGLLPKKRFLPIVQKGWKALVNSVDTEGKLCWVQPVGADPKQVQKSNTEVYGTGAFLMSAAEVYKLSD